MRDRLLDVGAGLVVAGAYVYGFWAVVVLTAVGAVVKRLRV